MDPLACLPHRPPIRLLERALEVSPTGAVAELVVAEGPHCAQGSLWAGGVIEALAQTAALMAASAAGAGTPRPVRGLLVGVRGFDLLRAPRIGETLRCAITLSTRLGSSVLVDAVACVGEERVAAGRLQFVLLPEDDAEGVA